MPSRTEGGTRIEGTHMPALITHHLFGERSATLLPPGIITGEEELLAFLLGNQGPDPFFFHFSESPAHLGRSFALAHRMHEERISAAFASLRDSVGHLPPADAGIGRAFALGMLSHYALDRHAHPFVYAQQFALINANEELADAGNEVHAVIEGDLDSWLLWSLRHATVRDCPPVCELTRTRRICQVAGALTSQVAWGVFSIEIPVSEYSEAVRDMAFVYRHIEPADSHHSQTVGSIERLVRSHSMLQALAHRVVNDDACPAANLEHRAWTSPFSGEVSHDSFKDRFDGALASWPTLVAAFTHGGDELEQAVGRLDYSGRILDATETKIVLNHILDPTETKGTEG